jgi:hypothetical protein
VSEGLRTWLDADTPDRVCLARGKAVLWLTRGEIQHLWQSYRPDRPVRVMATFPVDPRVAALKGL